MHVVFDLDGTLADTRDIVCRAYAAVGVDFPEWAWGKAWHEWLPAATNRRPEEVHVLKNVVYSAMVEEGVRALPAASLARALSENHNFEVRILTGASFEAAVKCRDKIGLERIKFLGTNQSTEGKVRNLASFASWGVYFDDDAVAAATIASETAWRVALVTEESTVEEMTEALWTP